MAIGIGLGIAGIGALIGGLAGADASRSAANTQADAAKNATAAQLQMFNTTQGNLAPYMQGGTASLAALEQFMGITPGTPGTPGTAATPGQFVGGGVTGGTPTFSTGDYTRPDSTFRPQGAGQMIPGSPGTPGTPGTASSFNPNAPGVKPFTLADFQASPAYNFNLQQGQQAIDKAANARGNLYAPQTLQDISKYSQGVASNEFQNAFSNYNTTQNSIFSRLSGMAGSGQNAAANLGGFAGQVGGQIGCNMIGAGNAQAAGTIGQANAISGAGSGIYNAYIMQQILAQQNQGLYGGGAGQNASLINAGSGGQQ